MKLGSRQRGVLKALRDNGPYPLSGWYWDGHKSTVDIAETLLKRGLVKKESRTIGLKGYERVTTIYTINDAGLSALESEKEE